MCEMNAPRKISDLLPSTCQKLLKSVEICLSSDKNKSAQFFWYTVYTIRAYIMNVQVNKYLITLWATLNTTLLEKPQL